VRDTFAFHRGADAALVRVEREIDVSVVVDPARRPLQA
jgi:hypothetical protein